MAPHGHIGHHESGAHLPAQISPAENLSENSVTATKTFHPPNPPTKKKNIQTSSAKRSRAKLNIPAERSTPVTLERSQPDSWKKGSKAPGLNRLNRLNRLSGSRLGLGFYTLENKFPSLCQCQHPIELSLKTKHHKGAHRRGLGLQESNSFRRSSRQLCFQCASAQGGSS